MISQIIKTVINYKDEQIQKKISHEIKDNVLLTKVFEAVFRVHILKLRYCEEITIVVDKAILLIFSCLDSTIYYCYNILFYDIAMKCFR